MRIILLVLAFCLTGFSEESDAVDSILDRKIESFEVNGSLKEALEALREQLYTQVSKPSQLNIVYISSIKQHDGLGLPPASEEDLSGELKLVSASKEFSFTLERKTFREILIQVCSKWNLRYIIDDFAVIISQPTYESEVESPKFYSLRDVDLDKVGTSNVKGFLEFHDICYEKDQPVIYLKALNSLAVVLSHHNHKKLDLVLSRYSLKAKFDKMNKIINNNALDKEGLDEFKKEFSSLYKQSYRKELIEGKSLSESPFQRVVPKVKVENYSLEQIAELIQDISKSLSENGKPVEVNISKDFYKEVTGRVSLNLNEVPLEKMIEYACKQLELSYHLEKGTVYLHQGAWYNYSTVLYPISAQLLVFFQKETIGQDYTSALKSLGIEFGPGSRIKFPKTQMALVITASEESHKKIKEVFDFLNSVKSRDPFDE